MKILIINNNFGPSGGAEVIAYNTYLLLKQNDHEVFFWSRDNKPYFEPDYEYQNYFTKKYGGTLDYLKNPVKFYWNHEAKSDLEKFLKDFKIDLIHLHCFDSFSPSILECCKNIPTIMTVHDPGLVCPTFQLMYKNQRLCYEQFCKNGNFMPCILNKCSKGKLEPSIRKSLFSYILHKKIKYINHFITPSKALKDQILKAQTDKSNDDITVINNFLPNNELNIRPNYSNQKYFLYTGRLVKVKGINYVLEALKELPRDIKFHIAGDGPEMENLKNYALKNELINVKFLGFLNREQIKNEYQNCIASILPCNWFENFPTANMESFINGKPVIASNLGGIPEQVEHDKTGLLFKPADIEQLKRCILKYWNNPELVIEHGKNAYEKVNVYYTEDNYYKKLIQTYSLVLKGKESEYIQI